MALHIRGQARPHTVSVAMRMSDLTLDDGTVVPGPTGAALLDGPFLYEHAPSNLALVGPVQLAAARGLDASRGIARSRGDPVDVADSASARVACRAYPPRARSAPRLPRLDRL